MIIQFFIKWIKTVYDDPSFEMSLMTGQEGNDEHEGERYRLTSGKVEGTDDPTGSLSSRRITLHSPPDDPPVPSKTLSITEDYFPPL